MKYKHLFSLILLLGLSNFTHGSGKAPFVIQLAEAFMRQNPSIAAISTRPNTAWRYDLGVVSRAYYQLYKATGDKRYFDYMKAFADHYVTSNGEVKKYKIDEYNIDRVQPARDLILLYKETGDTKYRTAMELFVRQMEQHPRNSDGGYWHKKIYPHQMWLDGLYMASPFLAQYAAEYGQTKWFDEVVLQLRLAYKHTRDPKTGLLYHAWDESRSQPWCDPMTGQSRHIWGRAVGWYYLALLDVLDYLPQNHSGRPELVAIVQELSKAILSNRDPKSKLWYQVMEYPGREGNYIEGSASAMFIYGMAKGYIMGYLNKSYWKAARKSYTAAQKTFFKKDDPDMVMQQICGGAGLGGRENRDGTYSYYIHERITPNDVKGIGPMIMAGILIENVK